MWRPTTKIFRMACLASASSLTNGSFGLASLAPFSEAESPVSARRIHATRAHAVGHVLLHSELLRTDSESFPFLAEWSAPRAPSVLCRVIGPSRHTAQ